MAYVHTNDRCFGCGYANSDADADANANANANASTDPGRNASTDSVLLLGADWKLGKLFGQLWWIAA